MYDNLLSYSEVVLDPSFQSSSQGLKPVYREIKTLGYSYLLAYMTDGTISLENPNRGYFKHKIRGYQLYKEKYV